MRFLETIPRARELFTVFFDEEIRVSRYDSENQQGLFARIHERKAGATRLCRCHRGLHLARPGLPGAQNAGVLQGRRRHPHHARRSEIMRWSGQAQSPSTRSPSAAGRGRIAACARAPSCSTWPSSPGARCSRPRTSRDLSSIYDQILDELSSQYVLGYVSDDTRRNGMFRAW